MIKRLLRKIKFEVKIHLLWGHDENIGEYWQNPLKHLIKQYDRKARKKREEIESEVCNNNIKYYGIYVLEKDGIAQTRSTKEVFRIIDAKKEEKPICEKNKSKKHWFGKMQFIFKKQKESIIAIGSFEEYLY